MNATDRKAIKALYNTLQDYRNVASTQEVAAQTEASSINPSIIGDAHWKQVIKEAALYRGVKSGLTTALLELRRLADKLGVPLED